MKPYDIEQVGVHVRLAIGHNTTVMSAQGALDMAMELLTAGRAAMQTTAVALRLWLTRGIISRETYSSAARSLLAAVAADERVRPLLGKVDEARFLLASPVAPAVVANDSEAA